MTDTARGAFEVKLTPQPSDRQPDDPALGRMWLDKHRSFVLQHNGTMTRGAPSLAVVPDSGTQELAGLSGRMTIVIADGKYSYELEYAHALDAAP